MSYIVTISKNLDGGGQAMSFPMWKCKWCLGAVVKRGKYDKCRECGRRASIEAGISVTPPEGVLFVTVGREVKG